MGWVHALLHWLTVHTGSSNTPGVASNYNFWSGFGSDIGELAILGGVAGMYRKHNCHHEGCWRVGRHVVDGTPWCNRHHQDARDRHHEAERDRWREIQVVPGRTTQH